jgi:protein-disulfide isomerase
MHDTLFQKHLEVATADYNSYATHLGLNTTRFQACLDNHTTLAKVKADQDLSNRLRIQSTPTLFIGRMQPDGGVSLLKRVAGAQPAKTFIDEVVKMAAG